jgi:NAD+ kinase
VIDDRSEVTLNISVQNEMPLQVSCDGHRSYPITAGQKLQIKKSEKQLQLLHPKDYRYYDTLRLKLGWGSEG